MVWHVINTVSGLIPEARQLLRENDCQVQDVALGELSEADFGARLGGIRAVITSGEWWTAPIFAAARDLRIVARTGAGVDRIDLEAAARHGVWVTNTPGATDHAVADFTLGLILCLLRGIPAMAQEMKAGRWNPLSGRELGSLTVGVVGAGRIGREVIKRAAAFGPRIMSHDIHEDPAFGQRYQCKTCQKTFIATTGTLFFRKRTAEHDIPETLALLAEGSRISSVSRVKRFKEDTILAWLREAAQHAAALEEVLMQDYRVERGQIDALWAHVGNKGEKKLS